MKLFVWIVVAVVSWGALVLQAKPDNSLQKLCDDKNIFIQSDTSFNFSNNEKIILCGDDTPGWQNVPDSQSLYELNILLRNRGYYNSSQNTTPEKTIVQVGKISKIKKIVYENEPEDFGEISYVGVLGKTLKSDNIETLEKWSLSRLKAIGYPCAKLQTTASYKDSQVVVTIDRGPLVYVPQIIRDDFEQIDPNILSRFDAIKEGDQYNADYFQLSSRRLLQSGIADYSVFKPACKNNNVVDRVKHEIRLSEPRYLGFAIGASTEEFPLLKAQWRHNRLDRNASTLELEAYLSPLKRSLVADYNYFPFRNYPRFSISPSLSIKRETEDIYESLAQKFGLAGAYFHDFSDKRLSVEVKPVFTIEDSDEGQSPEHTEYLSLESQFALTSHYFQFFRSSPRAGYQIKLFWKSQSNNLGADRNIDLIQLKATTLSNYGKIDPPVLIFGARFTHSSLFTSSLESTPQSYRLYLGGDESLRGFGRNQINNLEKGYQSTTYLGLEARFAGFLNYKLQPFVFYDLAKVGLTDSGWSSTLFSSPGVGLRWESPIGAFRGTIAKGIVSSAAIQDKETPEEWNYFISFGREF